jgi:carbon-monoxide dehydrogenase medium subunit
MFPPRFEYSAPTSLEEATAKLADLGEEARVLAGGQSLIPMMKLRLAAPAHLVDINRLPDLGYIRRDNGHLAIGALARHAQIASSTEVKATSQTMASAAPWIADPLVRNRGTLCGSVAHCDPEGDWNSVMLALGAEVVAVSGGGERSIPITDFVVDFFTNSLRPGEMVKEVRVPVPKGPHGGKYLKLERKIGDYATVGVAVHLEAADGKISRAGIALTSVHPHNLKVTEAETLLTGQAGEAKLFDEVANVAARSCEPASDVRGPAEYKRAVVREYTRRGLASAWTAAIEGGQS